MDGKVDLMKSHLQNKCGKVTREVKTELREWMAEAENKRISKCARKGTPIEKSGNPTIPFKNEAVNTGSSNSQSKFQGNLSRFYGVGQEQTKRLHVMLLEALIHANVPFNFLDNHYFRSFMHSLSPTYHPPSR